MASSKLLMIVVVFVLLFGAVLNLAVAPFLAADGYDSSSVLGNMVDFVDNGFTLTLPIIGEWNLNFFAIFGNAVNDFFVDQLSLFTYMPDSVSIPILILLLAAFVFVIATLIRGN